MTTTDQVVRGLDLSGRTVVGTNHLGHFLLTRPRIRRPASRSWSAASAAAARLWEWSEREVGLPSSL